MYNKMLSLLGNEYPHQAVIPLRTSCLFKPLLVSVLNTEFSCRGDAYICLLNEDGHFLSGGVPSRKNGELKQAMFMSHEEKPEVNISHARRVVSTRFSNLTSLRVKDT